MKEASENKSEENRPQLKLNFNRGLFFTFLSEASMYFGFKWRPFSLSLFVKGLLHVFSAIMGHSSDQTTSPLTNVFTTGSQSFPKIHLLPKKHTFRDTITSP